MPQTQHTQRRNKRKTPKPHTPKASSLRKLWKQIEAPLAKLFERPHARYMGIGLLMFAVLLFVILRILFFVFSADAEKYRAMRNTMHTPKPMVLPPLRGTIYSSDNRPVAVTAPTYRYYIDFKAEPVKILHTPDGKLTEEERKEKSRLAQQLSTELDSLSYLLEKSFAKQSIKVDRKVMRERWRKGYKIAHRYTPMVLRDINFLQDEELKQHYPFRPPSDSLLAKGYKCLVPKMLTAPEYRNQRINPFGSLALRTIGSVYSEGEGSLSKAKQGLELGFDSLLRGQEGQGLLVYGAKADNVRVLLPPTDGNNVYTTLDMNIQSQLERIMRKQLGSFKAESGTAILLDVHSGRVLAMTNLNRSASGGYIEGQNFAITDMSEPGSTFKVASMLVALENKLVKPTDSIDVGNGVWEVARRNVRDHNAHQGGYGRITVSQVIERSSNVGVAKIIYRHFKDKPSEYVRQIRDLAFGYDLRVEIPGGARAKVRMPNERWYGTTLAWMSFGYETQIPPMYTAAFFNAIANGGKLYKPYLVREVRDKYGQVIQKFDPQVVREQIASPQSIAAIQDMLRKVVTEGTGKKLNSKVVAVSGKSGTAQIAKGGGYRGADGTSHQVSFCGYFPSEAPRYTLMVVIREPSKEFSAGGGSMAGPVVKELAEAIISMEKPVSLDSIGSKAPSGASYAWTARGRKASLEALARALPGGSYKPKADIEASAYVAVDSLAREALLKPYPAGIVPNVYGMSAEDAHYWLMKSKYKARIKGYGTVVEQSPVAGTKLAPGKSVEITLR